MRIEYIYNSGFHIETENHQLVIDYYRGKLNLVADKPCTFIVTHAHADHFDPIIFDLARPTDHFILSRDTAIEASERVHLIDVREQGEYAGIRYSTCGSTDAGVSIMLEVDGQRIIHAGDLNLWIWPEDTPQERAQMDKDFEQEVACLAQHKDIDLAFFPVDGRLEERYLPGVLHFISEVQPKVFIPMHFRDDYSVLRDFSRRSGNPGTRVLIPSQENDVFEL